MGMTVRVTIFQSSLSENGMTGWTLGSHCVTLLGPMPIEVVLERHTTIGDRVLRGLGQRLAVLADAARETPNRPTAPITSVSVPCTAILPNESTRRPGRSLCDRSDHRTRSTERPGRAPGTGRPPSHQPACRHSILPSAEVPSRSPREVPLLARSACASHAIRLWRSLPKFTVSGA